MSIELEPSLQLSFKRPLTESIRESLIIRNTSPQPIVFKVKTTAPKQYCVRPNTGRIEVGQEMEIQVQMQAMKVEPPLDFKCKDKFLIQSIAITPEREKVSLADQWDIKDHIHEKKIRCVFLPGPRYPPAQEGETFSPPVTVQNSDPTPSSPLFTEVTRTTIPSVEYTEFMNLKRELETANETINTLKSSVDKLQQETYSLRLRKVEPNIEHVTARTIVPVNQPQNGYPVTYIAGAAIITFIFAYLIL